MKLKKNIMLCLFLGLSAVGLTDCASGLQMISKHSTGDIIIDGDQQEWNNKLDYIKDENFVVGFQNDAQNLYMCFVTSDRNKMMSILRPGMTLWLEPENGKILGVQFPLKLDREDFTEFRTRQDPDGNNQRNPGERKFDFSKMLEKQNEFLIVNEDNYPLHAFPTTNSRGFQVTAKIADDKFVYEIKIPLKNNLAETTVLNSLPGENINIRFESGEMERPNFDRSGPGGEGIEAGAAGRSGGRMGGRGSEGMRMGRDTAKIDYEFRVKLSI